MDYRYYIARRYLIDWKKISMISLISGISFMGVVIGVFAMVVVLSVMNGFGDVVRGLLVDLDPHIRIVSANERGFKNADSLQAQLGTLDGVVSTSAYLEGKALLVRGGNVDANRVVLVRGVNQKQLAGVSSVVDQTTIGEFDVKRNEGRAGIVIGSRLGQELSLFTESDTDLLSGTEDMVASQVQLLSAPGIERMMNSIFSSPAASLFDVRGWYDMNTVPEYDETNVFIDLAEAQRLFRTPGEVSGIELRLEDSKLASRVKGDIQTMLSADKYEVLTWYDIRKELYDVMELEKWGASLIIALIIVIAAFNIVGSLTMVVMEKRYDIGVLMSMGVSREDIRKIFLLQGAIIGIAGTGVGLITGLGLCLLQQQFGLVPLIGSDSFILDAYPVSIEFLDVSIIVVITIGLCLLAAIYPAHRASLIKPAEAVQIMD
ncbi:MAG: FtsX-like permease family protein [Rhodothermaceae bacterium]|nr:FtsX-like permease family protein [Rhodothermaceae bacterium]